MAKQKNDLIKKVEPMDSTAEPMPDAPCNGIENPRTGIRIALGAVGGVMIGVAVAICLMLAASGFQTAQRVETIETEQAELEQKVNTHTHTWVPNYVTLHHDAVTNTVWHAPVYSTETTYHTVCNECGAVIDGIAASHIADTGHSGYSTSVPITNEVLVTAGYNEVVVVQAAWEETVVDGATCTSCGEVATAEQVAEDGSIVIDTTLAENGS